MQKRPKAVLPSWLLGMFVLMFVGHFSMVMAYQFGKGVLPKTVVQWVDDYNLPWFYQNYLMFAPDPAQQMNTFLYRVEVDGVWGKWRNPVFPYQQAHWANRLGPGSDMVDIIMGIADALYNGVAYVSFMEVSTDADWHRMPAFELASRFVKKHSEEAERTDIQRFQVGVLTEHHRIEQGDVKEVVIFQPYPPKAW
jgi:hypothetical protein